MAELSAREQLSLELVNRARMDPLGEAARHGLADLNTGLAPGAITASPKQVLAPNLLLNDAARAHSQWMLDNDVFSHTGVNGSSPAQRMASAGYVFSGASSSGENISWSGSTGFLDADAAVESQHRSLFLSAGHRANTLKDAYREAGEGALTGQFTTSPPNQVQTYNALMSTHVFARSGPNVFVTGVTYNDADGNRFYTIGEGIAGRTFELRSGGALLASTAGMGAGGYAIGVASTGPVELRVVGSGITADIGAAFTLGAANVKVDLVGSSTIESNVATTLTRATANLTLLGIDNLAGTGNDLANTLAGNPGANRLEGGNGDDRLLGGAGNDTLSGGAGFDTADYSRAAGGVSVELWRGLAANDGQGGTDALVGIEHLAGSAFADLLAGHAGDNTFSGGAGNDSIYGGGGVDTADFSGATGPVVAELWRQLASSDGRGGADLLSGIEDLNGSAFADVLAGDTGNNTFRGGGGNDSIYGGAGSDTVDYSSAVGPVVAELWRQFASNDGQGGADILSGIENLTGSALNDLLAGNTGDNLFRGGQGNDSLYGGAGVDTVDYSAASGAVTAELWRGAALNDGQGGVDILNGIENLIGSGFSDVLGGDGNANRFEGGGGADTMAGAAGADQYVFRSGGGFDVINDFSSAQGDKIYIQSNINGSGITTPEAARFWTGYSLENGTVIAMLVQFGGFNTVSVVGVTELSPSDFVIF
jgi:Ca2+-binding RTX toxin-like protein